jgi:hypothetical protein
MPSSKTLLVTTTTAFTGISENRGDQILLFDDHAFEVLDKFQLMENEMVCSATSILLRGEDKEFYAVGSAFSTRTETEPSKVRNRYCDVLRFIDSYDLSQYAGTNSPSFCGKQSLITHHCSGNQWGCF